MLKEMGNLSQSQKLEGQNALPTIVNLLSGNTNMTTNSQDFSVENTHLNRQDEAMDLPMKNKSFDSNKSPMSKNPPPYGVYNPHSSIARSTNNSSNGSVKNSSGSQFKKSKTLPSKREPLRTMLPKLTLQSKKTSTPLQEPKLKPMAASTPASPQSNTSKPKLTRSFFYQARSLNKPASTPASPQSNTSKPKLTRSFFYQARSLNTPNSVNEMANNSKKDVGDLGPSKESRMELRPPSRLGLARKVGKENFKP